MWTVSALPVCQLRRPVVKAARRQFERPWSEGGSRGPRFGLEPMLMLPAMLAVMSVPFVLLGVSLIRENGSRAKNLIRELSEAMPTRAKVLQPTVERRAGSRTEKVTTLQIGESAFRFFEITDTVEEKAFYSGSDQGMKHYRLESLDGGRVLELTDWVGAKNGTGGQNTAPTFYYNSYGFFEYRKSNKRIISRFRELIGKIQHFAQVGKGAGLSTRPMLLDDLEAVSDVDQTAEQDKLEKTAMKAVR